MAAQHGAAAAPLRPRHSGKAWLVATAGAAGACAVLAVVGTGSACEHDDQRATTALVNWSATHRCDAKYVMQPESLNELEAMVREAHRKGKPIRVMGSGLSPNGLAFHEDGMLSMGLMDKVVSVDKNALTVTVQAGVTVRQLVEALRPHGMTLQNLASISEQQIGGFVQAGAHGTGAAIPPVDCQVTSLKLVTPGKGTILVTPETDPELFSFTKVGLGALGVVAEVTLKCVPAHKLVEHTFVCSVDELKRKHGELLAQNRHVRYMWLPWTDTVVVVTSNPHDPATPLPPVSPIASEERRLAPVRALLRRTMRAHGRQVVSDSEINNLRFTQLRNCIIEVAPLDVENLKTLNQAEAEFWKQSEGIRVADSDKVLGFDCGGQQWVYEAAFPVPFPLPEDRNQSPDMEFVEDILRAIKDDGVAAPCPIEQRWTATSSSAMSPASPLHDEKLVSWVGIVMYMPIDHAADRQQITAAFHRYTDHVLAISDKYHAFPHWAKLEIPQDPARLQWWRDRLARRYPVAKFGELRRELDPKGILSNRFVNLFLGDP